MGIVPVAPSGLDLAERVCWSIVWLKSGRGGSKLNNENHLCCCLGNDIESRTGEAGPQFVNLRPAK